MPRNMPRTGKRHRPKTAVKGKLDNGDFQRALETARQAINQHEPEVVVDSSRGGARPLSSKSAKITGLVHRSRWQRYCGLWKGSEDEMIEVYHCPKCSRPLMCEGVVSVAGHDVPVFQCDDCIVKKTIFGPGTEPFEVAYTFCVDSAGRCFDPADDIGESHDDSDIDDDFDPSQN